MFNRTRTVVIAVVLAVSTVAGILTAQATDRPMALVVLLGVGALIASIVLVVGSGSRYHAHHHNHG